MAEPARPKVQIGVARNKQFVVGGTARHHIVERDDNDRIRLICTNGVGTREYAGFLAAVTCDRCVALWIKANDRRSAILLVPSLANDDVDVDGRPSETCPQCGTWLTDRNERVGAGCESCIDLSKESGT